MAEPLSLQFPLDRERLHQLRELWCRAAIQDAPHDVRREQGQAQNPTDIGEADPLLPPVVLGRNAGVFEMRACWMSELFAAEQARIVQLLGERDLAPANPGSLVDQLKASVPFSKAQVRAWTEAARERTEVRARST